jgi:uncharacterized GH25 family protein
VKPTPFRLATSITACALAIATSAGTLFAHDFFFRPDHFFTSPGATVVLRALNGTFSKSENSITRDRLSDLSVVSSRGRNHPDTLMWSSSGDTSTLTVHTQAAGTYVVGASLKPRQITLTAKDFNQYLADDGIPDVLVARRKSGALDKQATERYSKHIKALIQVGPAPSGDYSAVLGYPAEIIPLDNPYGLRRGSVLRVRAMVDGQAVPGQLVVSGGRSPVGARFKESQVRTDASGVARVTITGAGDWYVKFIHMVPFRGTEQIDYESKWATLTFGVR